MQIKKDVYVRNGIVLQSLEIHMKNTTLLVLEGYDAFFMCGALDPSVYGDREVICGRARGVKTISELYNAEICDLSSYAYSIGLKPGMKVYEAFKQISQKK